MIVEFEPNRILLSSPPQWWLYYKQENEPHFNKISVTYEQLKLFLEMYGYETNDIIELKKFGVDVKNVKHNRNLK
jgi:hypothetical protein